MIDIPARSGTPKAPLPVAPIPHLEEFCRQIGISQTARQLLRSGLTPWGYLGRLLARAKYSDAIRLLAYLLPKRQAVWWACLCVRRVFGPGLGPKQTLALQAVVRWVVEPNETNCLATEGAARMAGLATPAGCLALGTFWGGQSPTPPDQAAVPPDSMLTANAVTGVIQTVAAEEPSSEFDNRLRVFLAMGIHVAEREFLWSSR